MSMQDPRTLGLPDVELAGAQGATVNPSNFAGHDLIVLFCPANRQEAARELAEYNALADALAYNDAYMVAVCDPDAGKAASRISIASDAEHAWDAFGKCLSKNQRASTSEGATFLFGRGGCLREVWQGVGHASEVMEALGERM
jgi:peroxiredoxin